MNREDLRVAEYKAAMVVRYLEAQDELDELRQDIFNGKPSPVTAAARSVQATITALIRGLSIVEAAPSEERVN